jgi:hypothetical protein
MKSFSEHFVHVIAAGMGHHQRSVIEPRWKVSLPSENNGNEKFVREGSRHIIADSNKPVSTHRKLSDSNNVGSSAMDVNDELSDSRTNDNLKMPSQPKLLIPSIVHMSTQDVQQNGTDFRASSDSPTPFQSLEGIGSHTSGSSHVHQSIGNHVMQLNMHVLHPSINNLSFSGCSGVENRSGLPGK